MTTALCYIVMTRDVCVCAHLTVSTLKWFSSNKQLRQFIPSKLFKFIFSILYYYIVYIKYRYRSNLYISDDRIYSHIPSHVVYSIQRITYTFIFVENRNHPKLKNVDYITHYTAISYAASEVLKSSIYNLSNPMI